ncbi:hypothetical protein FB451DRAFT_459560 [Mycena latifolia]|nr:hypothetical protein FB451DRAFT_459560 [Mycena latifolia]
MSENNNLQPPNLANVTDPVNATKVAAGTTVGPKDTATTKDRANTMTEATTLEKKVALNEQDTDKAKRLRDQLEKLARKCGCDCLNTCNCKCTCAFRQHCMCKSPCDGQCGNRVSRNLVVSIDGTSNQFGIYNTNVVELHSRVLADEPAKQNKYYNCGIGTYVPPEAKTSLKYLRQRIDNKIDLAIAWNFKEIILKAYRWLSQTYLPGDKIFIFGFSRGAYQVRTLAGMIEKVGLVHSGNEEMIPFAYEVYSERHKGKVTKAKEAQKLTEHFKNTFSRDIRIHFAGLWDTVSSVGIVRGKPLPLTRSAEHICIVRHALALDEGRVKFLPEYVADGDSAQSSKETPTSGSEPPAQFSAKEPPGSASASTTETPLKEVLSWGSAEVPNPKLKTCLWDVKEVWFPGTHSDIGGGLEKNIELNLSSVSLLWMENEATSAGLRLKPRPSGGSWQMSELLKDNRHESLRGFWRFMEHLPLKRLTCKKLDEVTRTPHRGAGRIIVPGQRIHISIAFTKLYAPRAKFLSETHVEWESLVGKGINLAWSSQLAKEVELDLFDASFMIEAVEQLRALRAKGDTSEKLDYWVERLHFMALSGQLAANYLSKFNRDPRGKTVREVGGAVDLFQYLRTRHPGAFDADVAALLEQKSSLLFAERQVDEALGAYRTAEGIRLDIARANKASEQAIEILKGCLEVLSGHRETSKLTANALVSIQEAVDFRRSLSRGDPNQPLASSLHSVGIVLRIFGHYQEALNAHHESVNLRRKMSETDPTITKDLIESLHNLGIDCRSAGRPNDALRADEEAVTLRRKTDPGNFRASLSQTMAALYRATGSHEQALDASNEAVDILRRLVETDSTVTKDLADALANLGIALSAVGRREDALRADEEAVQLHRRLVDTDPTITKNLATSLQYLAVDLSAAGRHDDAVHAIEEAVEIRRKLAETDPAVTRNLANSLHNLSLELRAVARHEDALHTNEEAIAIRRKLAKTDPTVTKYLANSLRSLGVGLRAVARHEDAVHVDEEAVAILRKLAETDPTVTKDLADSLHNLGHYLSAVARHEEAMHATEEAVAIRRKLAETDPTFTEGLARSLENLGVHLRAVGRHEAALGVSEEAVGLHRKSGETDSTILIYDLPHALQNLAFDLSAVNRHEDAVRASEEAVGLLQKVAEPTPRTALQNASTLQSLGACLRAAGRHEDGLRVHKEGAEIYHKLGETNPDDTAKSLHGLADDFRSIGLQEDALRAEDGAIEFYRKLVQTKSSHINILIKSLKLRAEDLRALGREEDAARADAEVVVLQNMTSERGLSPVAAGASSGAAKVAGNAHNINEEVVGQEGERDATSLPAATPMIRETTEEAVGKAGKTQQGNTMAEANK